MDTSMATEVRLFPLVLFCVLRHNDVGFFESTADGKRDVFVEDITSKVSFFFRVIKAGRDLAPLMEGLPDLFYDFIISQISGFVKWVDVNLL